MFRRMAVALLVALGCTGGADDEEQPRRWVCFLNQNDPANGLLCDCKFANDKELEDAGYIRAQRMVADACPELSYKCCEKRSTGIFYGEAIQTCICYNPEDTFAKCDSQVVSSCPQ
jgi:hypothetical protein